MNPLGLVVMLVGAIGCLAALGLTSEPVLALLGLAAGFIQLLFGGGR